jgi:hypothetical protein
MKLLRVMGNVSTAFQAYLETQTLERQRQILAGVKQFDQEQLVSGTALQQAYQESLEGWSDTPAGGFRIDRAVL